MSRNKKSTKSNETNAMREDRASDKYKTVQDREEAAEKREDYSTPTTRSTVSKRRDFRSPKHTSTAKYGDKNDWRWYAKDSALVKSAANYSFNNATGLKVPVPRDIDMAPGADVFPGVASINVQLVYGLSTSRTSALNIAADSLYSYVRKANSGSANYDPQDMMLYFMAVDNAIAYWQVLRRCYGIMNRYVLQNRYTPRAIVNSMGFDFDDLISNQAQFLWYINQYANRMKYFAIPSSMPIITRHNWLFANVFKDDDNDKAQYFLYNPDGFYRYNETGSEKGGFMEYIGRWPGDGATTYHDTAQELSGFKFTDIVNYGNQMLDALFASQDIGIINGDIKKAYTDAQLYIIPETPMDFAIEIVYDADAILQLHNAKLVRHQLSSADYDPAVINSNNITQDPNTLTLLFNPYCTSPMNGVGFDNTLIDMRDEVPTPEQVMEYTRFTVLLSGEYSTTTTKYYLDSCDSAIIRRISLWYYDYSSTGDHLSRAELENNIVLKASDIGDIDNKVEIIIDGSTTVSDINSLVTDISNYTTGLSTGIAKTSDLIAAGVGINMLTKFDWHILHNLVIEHDRYNYQINGRWAATTGSGPNWITPLFSVLQSVDTTSYYCGYVNDVSNYTSVDIFNLRKLHDTALLSEFDIPMNIEGLR